MSRERTARGAAVARAVPSFPLGVFFVTAFLEGLAVILVEIVGARALAPFFGSSLFVWTAQITATLLFLALGYRSGGWLCRTPSPWNLPLLFWAAGLWLVLYPFLRSPVLTAAAANLGVPVGSFVSATVLFGVPLLALGAVSPVLISYIDLSRPGAGSAAGSLFFTNTIGGLAGGWITAFVVIPYLPVRFALGGTGLVLCVLGALWAIAGRRAGMAAAIPVIFAVSAVALTPTPAVTSTADGDQMNIIFSHQSSVGLLQVIEVPALNRRGLMIDGALQGDVDMHTGRSLLPFIAFFDALAHRYHPRARSALLLGLGAGALGRQLHARGVEVTAAELDPQIASLPERFFGMPSEVRVHIGDARTFLRQDQAKYDLIFLDVFAGENVPWYLTTREAFEDIRARLDDGGRVLVNTVSDRAGQSPGLARVEATMLAVFPEVVVFLDAGHAYEQTVVNALLVAGVDLAPTEADFPFDEELQPRIATVVARGRPARATVAPGTDDFDDLDSADAGLRAEWRRLTLQQFGPEILGN